MAYRTIQQEYMQIPPVTRAYTTACVLTTVAVVSHLMLQFVVYFMTELFGRVWQVLEYSSSFSENQHMFIRVLLFDTVTVNAASDRCCGCKRHCRHIPLHCMYWHEHPSHKCTAVGLCIKSVLCVNADHLNSHYLGLSAPLMWCVPAPCMTFAPRTPTLRCSRAAAHSVCNNVVLLRFHTG